MPSWRDGLLPCSWRGIGCWYKDFDDELGRRAAVYEFIDSESVLTQDLGRRALRYHAELWVGGDDFMALRNALAAALATPGPGTFVHPYEGPLQLQLDQPARLRHYDQRGGSAWFEVQFVEAGLTALPAPAADTAAAAQADAAAAAAQLATDFAAAWAIAGSLTMVVAASVALLASVGTALAFSLSAPGSAAAALAVDLPLFAAVAPDAGAALSTSLQGLFADYVDGIVTDVAADANAPPPSEIEINSWGTPLPADPAYGLATIAANPLGGTASGVGEAATSSAATNNASALTTFIAGSAIAALASLYSQTDFASSDDADAARNQLAGLIDGQLWAAGNDGDDAAFLAWQDLKASTITDLTVRGKQLPNIVTIDFPSPMPALVVAQYLYQDGSEAQAQALVARNAAPHPLFMPLVVEALAPSV